MSDMVKKHHEFENDPEIENDDILAESVTDDDLTDDLGLNQSLKAAFDMERITVSEDLIAATLARINALKESGDEGSTEIDSAAEKTENSTGTDNVISISDKKRRFRSFMRIAGPVAAAFIVGILGISILRSGILGTKYSADNAASAPMAENTTQNTGRLKAESYDAYSYESAADNAGAYDTAENILNDFKTAAQSPSSVESDSITDFANGLDKSEAPADQFEIAAVAEDMAVAEDADIGDDPSESEELPGYAGIMYSFAIPAELVDEVTETAAAYASEMTSGLLYGGISDGRAWEISRDSALVKESAGATGAGAVQEESGAQDETAESNTGAEETADPDGDENRTSDLKEQRYLVIGNGVFYFVSGDTFEPADDTVIYIIDDPDENTDSLMEEIKKILGQ